MQVSKIIKKPPTTVRGEKLAVSGRAEIFEGFPVSFYDLKNPLSESEQKIADFLVLLSRGKKITLKQQGEVSQVLSKDFLDEFQKKILAAISFSGGTSKLLNKADFVGLKQNLVFLFKNFVPQIKNADYISELVLDTVFGFGVLGPLIRDEDLEEIMVNRHKVAVFVYHRKFGMCKTNLSVSLKSLVDLIQKIARTAGKTFDENVPYLDARLPDGNRANATSPSITPNGVSLTIRKFTAVPLSIIDLIANKTISSEVGAFLWTMVEGLNISPKNIIVTGGSSSGKTTTLNVLASFISHQERIITIEDTVELNLGVRENWVQMETPQSIFGRRGFLMDNLLRNSFRMRPDRLIVGEVRGIEAQTLFVAMDTGHQGAVIGKTRVQLSDGRIMPIAELAEKYFSKEKIYAGESFEFVEPSERIDVISFNKQNFSLEPRPVKRIWRKLVKDRLLKLKLKSGKSIVLTKDHPIYRINEGVQQVNSSMVKEGDFVAVPNKIEIAKNKSSVFEPYLAGLVYGDGHINQKMIHFVNSDKKLIKEFSDSLKNISTHKTTINNYDSFSRAQIWDSNLTHKFRQEYNIPFGNKTKTFVLNEKLLTADNKELALFLRGMFDCEASVNLHSNSIVFGTSNPDLAAKMPFLLLRFGITSSTYIAERDGKGNMGPYYHILIYGLNNILHYYLSIGFSHRKKTKKLRKLIKRCKKSIDLIPNIEKTLKQVRILSNLTQQQLAEKIGNKSRSVIKAYENKQRRPTRDLLARVCNAVSNELSEKLKSFAVAPVNWEQVKSVEEINFEGFVYDLTVDDNHTYIANGFIVSNCMGTLHANTGRETLLRLKAPPMSVPEVMIPLLDLIVVQFRMHVRGKGVIRRVTQISEITSMEGKPLIANIFEWDRKEDRIKRTDVPSHLIEEFAEQTKATKKEIRRETNVRKKVLEWMLAKKITATPDVEKVIQKYYYNPKAILEQVVKDMGG